MSFRERRETRARWQSKRNSAMISYFTQTRGNTQFQISIDVIPYLHEHLDALTAGGTRKRKIDLVLHSNGGDGVVPWRLCTLIREYASAFTVVIPHRAFSAGTLIAMGADGILMHPMGMLGPTDPTVANHFNPPDPNNSKNRLGISVEDVYSYLALVRDDIGLKSDTEMALALKALTDQIHPLALGNVKRFYAQARMMAKKLLALHMNKDSEHAKIEEIADSLTSKLYFHGHPINRSEARGLGLKVKDLSKPLEKLVWGIYQDIESEMQLHAELNLVLEFIERCGGNAAMVAGAVQHHEIPVIGAMLESDHGQHLFEQRFNVMGAKQADGATKTQISEFYRGWRLAAHREMTALPVVDRTPAAAVVTRPTVDSDTLASPDGIASGVAGVDGETPGPGVSGV